MKRLFVFLLLIFTFTGCQPTPPQVTLAVLPSDTQTPIPTITPTASATRTATATFVPTLTLTPTPTTSLLLTPSPTAIATSTPTIATTVATTATTTTTTALPLLIPTRTGNANAATASRTPLPTRTPRPTHIPTDTPAPTVVPAITRFTVSPASVLSGGSVRITWETNAENATLDQLTDLGGLINSQNIPASGTLTLPINLQATGMIFRITVIRSGNTATRSVRIALQCQYAWYFQPAPPVCAPQVANGGIFEYQKFQFGLAIYAAYTNTVYVLADFKSRVSAYQVLNTPFEPADAPSGFIDPTSHIGWAWHTQRLYGGRSMLDVIGWGVGNMQVYTSAIQAGVDTGDVYLQTPDGAVYKLSLTNGGTWVMVAPGAG